MIDHVDQQYLHGEGDENGDCERAAIASLFRLPIEDVPHFCSRANEHRHAELLEEWLQPFGLTRLSFRYDRDIARLLRGVAHLLSGPSPRFPNEYHCVVAHSGEIIHDPHPDRTGLAPPTDEMPWLAEVFIARHPAEIVALRRER